jgi:hypothetical protein
MYQDFGSITWIFCTEILLQLENYHSDLKTLFGMACAGLICRNYAMWIKEF